MKKAILYLICVSHMVGCDCLYSAEDISCSRDEACPPGNICVDEICEPGERKKEQARDAGTTDAVFIDIWTSDIPPADAAGGDGWRFDAGAVDSNLLDLGSADLSRGDTQGFDSQLPDGQSPDGHSPDTQEAAILDLLWQATGTTSITLQWEDTSDRETGFRVQRRDFGAGVFVTIAASLPANTEDYVDLGCAPDSHYEYRVTSVAATGSLGSVESDAWSLPHSPTDLQLSSVSTTDIQLVWDDQNNSNHTDYILSRRSSGGVTYATLATVGSGTWSHLDTTGDEGESYDYRVVAVNLGGQSAPVEGSERTLFGPVLSWFGPPELSSDCELSVPGMSAFDTQKGASFLSASGTLGHVASAVAFHYGISGTLEVRYPTTFSASWTVRDSKGGTSILIDSLKTQFSEGPYQITDVQPPQLVLGEDGMEGRQISFSSAFGSDSCVGCSGTRGSIALGDGHSCVLTQSRRVLCWGHNNIGQLGIGVTGTFLHTPHPVCLSGSIHDNCSNGVYLENVVAIAAGMHHTCALLMDQTAKCWGLNIYGQIGDGTDEGLNCGGEACVSRPLPATVCSTGSQNGEDCIPLLNSTSIAAGLSHTCATIKNGEVRCWGDFGYKQLNHATFDTDKNPAQVCTSGSIDNDDCVPLTDATTVVAGTMHSCSIHSNGGIMCWGDRSYGQTGGGFCVNNSSKQATSVCSSGSAMDGDCVPASNAVSVTAGFGHTCIITKTNTVECWGVNVFGQIGDGTTGGEVCSNQSLATRLNPVTVCQTGSDATCVPLAYALSISASSVATCAIAMEGKVFCWGQNNKAQLGTGDTSSYFNPMMVCSSGSGCGIGTSLANTIAIASGTEHNCVLYPDGSVGCWGSNQSGRLGDGTNAGDDCEGSPCRKNPVKVCTSGEGTNCVGGSVFSAAAQRSCAPLTVIR